MARVYLHAWQLTGSEFLRSVVEEILDYVVREMTDPVGGFYSQPKEIAIISDPESAATQALLNVVRDGYRPFQVVALGAPSPERAQVPLLQDRGLVEGQAVAYVCRNFACQAPVTETVVLRQLLQSKTLTPALR